MSKYLVNYCPYCHRKTKHKVIRTKRLFEGGTRIWLGIMTCGMSEIGNSISKDYEVECCKCGNCTTVSD